MDSSAVPLAPAPPFLCVYFGVSLFSALKVPCVDHTFKDSQLSVVQHERAPTQELVFQVSPLRR